MKEIKQYNENIFEGIKHVNEFGQEYWLARELQPVLEYGKWDNFKNVINKAKVACENSGYDPSVHFADVGKTSAMPQGGERIIKEIEKDQKKLLK
ncbi:MAG: hypothetical protein JJE18_03420 [Eubacteriaceae bacterium]|nr:hypothetical protein [Eubacteriaceae bacterium]